MRSPMSVLRVVFAAVLLMLAAPAVAQTAPPEDEWQTVITSQIQAFRDGDAPAAFSYAGAGFQVSFPNAFVFFNSIMSSGYSPIMESKSHSFGDFQLVTENDVVQLVKFVGPSQELFEAVYNLAHEPEGWRVQGVALAKPSGVGI